MHFYHLLRVVQPCIHQLLLLLTLLATAAQVFADIPDEPEQLRYSVYSDTSAEIMWRRASNEAAVVAYEIKQNGEIIETRDTLSYFTNDLEKKQAMNSVLQQSTRREIAHPQQQLAL